ncbi:type II secretion system protein [Patescibacteria group bacterium]
MRNAFTIIELLVVIAIIVMLAVLLLIVIKPQEQLAKSRDSGKISAVNQLGKSVTYYQATRGGNLPNELNWAHALTVSSDLRTIPAGIKYRSSGVDPCMTNPVPNTNPTYCYDRIDPMGHDAIVFSRLEAGAYNTKCSAPQVAYFAYSTADARDGFICSNGDPVAWGRGDMVYLD